MKKSLKWAGLGMLAAALVCGAVLAGCKDDDDEACCTAETLKPLFEVAKSGGSREEQEAALKKLPACCEEALTAAFNSTSENPDYGCCTDAVAELMKELGGGD